MFSMSPEWTFEKIKNVKCQLSEVPYKIIFFCRRGLLELVKVD